MYLMVKQSKNTVKLLLSEHTGTVVLCSESRRFLSFVIISSICKHRDIQIWNQGNKLMKLNILDNRISDNRDCTNTRFLV